MRYHGAVAAVTLALSVSACASPREQRATALDAVLSWVATARLVSGHWLCGRTPTRYTRATLQAALQSLEAERARLASKPHTAADPSVQKALRVVEEVERAVSRMWAAVGSDRGRVEAERTALAALEGQLRALGARQVTP